MNHYSHPSQAMHPYLARPIRIALVTGAYNYIKDGVALTLNRLVEYLERQGVEVMVFAPVAPVAALAHHGTLVPVPSIALPSRPEYRLALGLPRGVRQRIEQFAPDIVHIAAPDFLGYGALRFAQKRGLPAVTSYHTRFDTYLKHYWYLAPLAGLSRRYVRWFYGACREVYVPSESMADTLLKSGFRDNFRAWPRGVDTVRFDPAKRAEIWRVRHGIKPGETAIIHVARLVREKQLDTLVAIARRVEAMGVAHRLVLVGDGPERAGLEKQLPRALFTGFLHDEELATAYASCDIFLFPSDTESFGNVTLEAMASGLACVCADATGSRSLVMEGETGFLAKPGEAEEFANRIAALVKDPGLRQRLGQAGRARSLSFVWDETMARLLGYYRALLETP